MSTSSPPQPAALDDGGSPSDPPAPAAVPVSSSSTTSEPSSTPPDRPTSDPSSFPSREPPRLESGADDGHTSVIDAALPSNHAGKAKEDEDKLDRFSCHIWCASSSRFSQVKDLQPDTAPKQPRSARRTGRQPLRSLVLLALHAPSAFSRARPSLPD